MADGSTVPLGLVQPEVGASPNTWGGKLNANFQDIADLLNDLTGHRHTGVNGDAPPIPPTALAGVVANGMIARISASAFIQRAIMPGNGIDVVNGDAVGGDPTIALTAQVQNAIVGLVTNPGFLVTNLGAMTGAVALNGELSASFFGTITGVTTLSFIGTFTVNRLYVVVLELTNGGAFGVGYPVSVKWSNGVIPTLSPAGVDQLVFTTRDGGTTWYGALRMSNAA
jgi:hypothetical protein